MATLTARILPVSRSSSAALGNVRTALRQLSHVSVSENETLTEWPEVGTVVVSELHNEIVVNAPIAAGTESAVVRKAIARHIRQAAGSQATAAKLVISWSELTPDRALLPSAAAPS